MTDRERIDDLAKRIEGLEQRVLGLDKLTPKLTVYKHYDWNAPSPYDLSATPPKRRRR